MLSPAAPLNDAYFNPGSYPVQYNVADSNMLKDMRKHPENHSDLMRRAASFTAKLIALDPTVQQQLSTAPSWMKPAFFSNRWTETMCLSLLLLAVVLPP